jgi:hypothetical protein
MTPSPEHRVECKSRQHHLLNEREVLGVARDIATQAGGTV